MRRTTRNCSTAMALVLTTAAPALAQATWTYSDIDQDGNLELSSAEFEAFGRELFVSWDANADQMIEENEFYGGVFDAWDVDSDWVLTESEYTEGWRTWFGDYDGVAHGDLDVNRDAALTEDEYATGLAEVGVYDAWTAGGAFGEDEFVSRLYDVYDEDDDKVITQAEYEAVGEFWSDNLGDTNAREAEIIALRDWSNEDLYVGGISAEDFVEEMEVFGVSGEEIGEVEDIIIGPDGKILSITAEVGGFWDIGDTHVSIPFEMVEMADGGVIVPIDEDNVGDYGYGEEFFSARAASTEAVRGVDEAEVVGGWRATEMIGDFARIRDGDEYTSYGHVSDLILRNGQVAAVVVQAGSVYGGGYGAFPYYSAGAGFGWDVGSPFYDMPYSLQEIGEVEEFQYRRLE